MPIKQAGTCELYKNEQCGAMSSLRLPNANIRMVIKTHKIVNAQTCSSYQNGCW